MKWRTNDLLLQWHRKMILLTCITDCNNYFTLCFTTYFLSSSDRIYLENHNTVLKLNIVINPTSGIARCRTWNGSGSQDHPNFKNLYHAVTEEKLCSPSLEIIVSCLDTY